MKEHEIGYVIFVSLAGFMFGLVSLCAGWSQGARIGAYTFLGLQVVAIFFSGKDGKK